MKIENKGSMACGLEFGNVLVPNMLVVWSSVEVALWKGAFGNWSLRSWLSSFSSKFIFTKSYSGFKSRFCSIFICNFNKF